MMIDELRASAFIVHHSEFIIAFQRRGQFYEVQKISCCSIVALLLANLLAFAISLAQQQAIWNTGMGWVTADVYFLFVLGYGYLVVKGRTARHAAHHA